MLNTDERLALLSALNKKIQPALEEAKSEACSELMERCREDGTDRRAVMVNGEKVGEIGIDYTKGHPVIIDTAAALDCLRAMGLTEEVPKKGWESAFSCVGGMVVDTDSAEVITWAQWEPSRPRRAAVRIKGPQTVINAFGARLANKDPLALLEESND